MAGARAATRRARATAGRRDAGVGRRGGARDLHTPSRRGGASASTAEHARVLHLQATAGNQAVTSLLNGGTPHVQRFLPSLDDLLNDYMDQPPVWDPSTGCRPFSSAVEAHATHQAMRGALPAAISVKFANAEVTRLWRLYINGGSSLVSFAGPANSVVREFTSSRTTASWNGHFANLAYQALQGNPPAFPPGQDEVVVPLSSLVDAATLATIDDPTSGMDFSTPTELPGNIAGGIGKDQVSTPVGARPSPYNDSRAIGGNVRVRRNPDGTMTMTTAFEFDVYDTIDLCPGNLGANLEQNLTIPLSRLEAHGLAGDVPFRVLFPGTPITRALAAPSPQPQPTVGFRGRVVASALRIRSAPSLSAPIVGRYRRGEIIDVEKQVPGTSVNGNANWDKTAQGFVADAYVQRLP